MRYFIVKLNRPTTNTSFQYRTTASDSLEASQLAERYNPGFVTLHVSEAKEVGKPKK